jgi:glycosyltransferase involved in cell wall biosynthesis
VRKWQIDLLHSHLPGMNVYAALASLLTGRPAILTYHGIVGNWLHKNLKNRVKFRLIKASKAQIVTVSRFLAEQVIQTWRLNPRRVRVIYNGIDVASFADAAPNTAFRREIGIAENAPLIGMVGNIRSSKAYDHFIECAVLVAGTHSEARFVIVGQGRNEALEQLRRRIEQTGLTGRVVLAGFREDIPQVLKSLDIFVLTSTSEGLSIATIEALAAGLPVVVSASGGPQEIVRDGETGLLVPPGEPAAFAEKISLLLQDQALARSLGERGCVDMAQRFDIRKNVAEYTDLYRSCL